MSVRSSSLFALSVALSVALAACSKEVIEPAPLVGGETLSYGGDTPPVTITVQKAGEGFVLSAPGYKAQTVAANLRDGRTRVDVLDLAMIWLEPSQRMIGGKTPVGTVTAEERKGGREAFKLSERNGQVEYWFEKNTGFLLERRVNPNGPSQRLVASTGVGL